MFSNLSLSLPEAGSLALFAIKRPGHCLFQFFLFLYLLILLLVLFALYLLMMW